MGVLLMLMLALGAVEAYKILVVFPLPGRSHSILGDGYVRLLLERGHEVTYVTPFPWSKRPANLTFVDVSSNIKYIPTDKLDLKELMKDDNILGDLKFLLLMSHNMSRVMLEHENVQTLMADRTQNFDIIIVEWFFNELQSGLQAVFGCPYIWAVPTHVDAQTLRLAGELPSPAYVPDIQTAASPPFDFSERVSQLWTFIKKLYLINYTIGPLDEQTYRNLLAGPARARGVVLPPYSDVVYNASLLLLNTHPSLGAAVPLPQNAKNVGGYHIRTTIDPLPEDLQKLMDESTNGVVYFSMGSNIRSSDMDAEMKRDLLKVFGELPQTVLWKFEEDLPHRPPNVHIRKWLPQPSLLAHPNLRVFVTHGGLLSTTEAVHFGVPLVAIPVFGDQFTNARRAADRGLAVYVRLSTDLPARLRAALHEVLHNSSYSARARWMSGLYHDRPLSGGAELVYWVEATVRTRGAPHLRTPALTTAWSSRLYLDLALLLLLTGGAILAILAFCLGSRKRMPQPKKKTS